MVAQTTPEPAVIVQSRHTSRLDKPLAVCIAELVVKYRLTESEACLSLNVRPKTWFNWKVKQNNGGKYEDILSRIRAGQLKNVIESISKAGDERTIVTRAGNKVQVNGDWRAKAWIAERVLAPERLGDRQPTSQPQTPLQVTILLGAAMKVYDTQQVKTITQPCHDVPQLSDCKPET